MNPTRLIEISIYGRSKDGHILCSYQCSCGNVRVIKRTRVKNGSTKSCGCLSKETKPNLIHGYKHTITYSSWRAAKHRAMCKTSKDFKRYGGAGIGFSERWLNFENFLSDMGERPIGTTLDRIDPYKGYAAGNCRWATPKEQSMNRKDIVFVVVDGERVPLVEYARKIGVNRKLALIRFRRGKLEGVCYG